MTAQRELRVYYGPEDSRSVPLKTVKNTADTVVIPLSQLLDSLGDAMQKQRAWVHDFCDEEVTVSTDLYELISAYRELKKSA